MDREKVFAILKLYKIPLVLVSIGAILALIGIGLIFRNQKTAIEFTSDKIEEKQESIIVVDVSGAVNNPGVYRFDTQIRLSDVVAAAGDFASDADATWISKNINLAAKVSDGSKLYIPHVGEEGVVAGVDTAASGTMNTLGKININTAAQSELESLSGIGEKTAQKIIDSRPYSSIDELVTKKVLYESVFTKIKDEIVAQ